MHVVALLNFTHITYNHFAGTAGMIRLSQCMRNSPEAMGTYDIDAETNECHFCRRPIAFHSMKNFKFRLRFHWSLFVWGQFDNIPSLVQMMAWHRTGVKPLSEPRMVQLTDAYYWRIYASLGLIELQSNLLRFKHITSTSKTHAVQ